ncbi:hypothetical protein LK09_17940 [Microbacterium mangrovi]|uniref:Uncharacterized protein n=2 Tax=Microbacterium mangrovi TaxID=1348253 RepID=A0A0B1ZYS1_9MICO|nr:hypothetical protein LK09_17940 [Microbacterium mangrovi]
MVGYAVVGPEWRSALVNLPLAQPGMAYAWTRAWKGDEPRAIDRGDVTVAVAHLSEAGNLRAQLNVSAQSAAPLPLDLADGAADVTLVETSAGQLTAELVDGETFILVIAHTGQGSLRIGPVTDRAPLIANWLAFFPPAPAPRH